MNSAFWNERFQQQEYIYGEEPNVFLAYHLSQFKPGKILFAAEGEGRNAVFAAKNNWRVKAFDISQSGKEKAEQLAEKSEVKLDYRVGDFLKMDFKENSFDAVALIFAHFDPALRPAYFEKLNNLLKPNGCIIFEGFGENHAEFQRKYPKIGGPKNPDLFFSVAEIKRYFPNYNIDKLHEKPRRLDEGDHHVGMGSVVQAILIKPRS